MPKLRTLSSRPEIIVDNQGFRLGDPSDGSVVGQRGPPFGRERVVTAIPLNDAETGPLLISPNVAVQDPQGFTLADPDNNPVGMPALWVHRMLSARWTLDTRRLS